VASLDSCYGIKQNIGDGRADCRIDVENVSHSLLWRLKIEPLSSAS
jgi:hypothetical protein